MLVPAIDTATPWPWKDQPKLARKITKSLICYVSPEDAVLSRKAFLRTVISRITEDLKCNTQ